MINAVTSWANFYIPKLLTVGAVVVLSVWQDWSIESCLGGLAGYLIVSLWQLERRQEDTILISLGEE